MTHCLILMLHYLHNLFMKGLIAAGFFILCSNTSAQFYYQDGFSAGDMSDWTAGTETAIGTTPALDDNWLRIIYPRENPISSYAYCDVSIPTTSASGSFTIQFDVTMWDIFWGGTAEAGMTFFMADASVDPSSFNGGGIGGSRGYANRNTEPGLSGGYFGMALDNHGGFSEATQGRIGGPGFTPNSVAVRGPEDSTYEYVNGTDTLSQALAIDPGWIRPDQTGPHLRRVRITLDENDQLVIEIQFGASNGFTEILTADLSGYDRPDTLRFGFTGGTGDNDVIAEVRRISIVETCAANTTALFWNNDLGNSIFGTGQDNNWIGDVNPTNYATLVFNDHYINADQVISVNDNDKIISNLYLSGANSYQFDEGTAAIDFVFNTNGNGSSSLIMADTLSGNAAHLFNIDIGLQNDLTIYNNTEETLTFAQEIRTNGHSLIFNTDNTASTATIIANGPIKGTGSVTKTGSGILALNGANTFSGDLIINEGTVLLGANERIADTTNLVLSGGTLATNQHDETLGTLTLSADSIIDLGSGGGSIVQFADSSGETWDGGSTLYITNWEGNWTGGGSDQIIFGSSISGLQASQVGQIRFVDASGLLYGAQILSTGEIVPVPEPATWISGLALFGLLAFYSWKKMIQTTSLPQKQK